MVCSIDVIVCVSVKPSPVFNLHKNDSNATCLVLVWYHSDLVHDKVPVVQYLSEWNSPHWHNVSHVFIQRTRSLFTPLALASLSLSVPLWYIYRERKYNKVQACLGFEN